MGCGALDADVAHHAVGLDALGADVQMRGCALYHSADALDVGVETTLVATVRVRNTHPEAGPFSTYFAYCCHNDS